MTQTSKNTHVILAYKRSAFDFATKGKLAKVRPDDLLSTVVKGLLQDVDLPLDDVEDLITGCAFPEGEQGSNIGRMVVLNAALGQHIGGMTVNRWCGSSMQAAHIAAGNIVMGAGKIFIAAGVESMSRVPMGGYNFMPNKALLERNPNAYVSMGITAENLAKIYNISRSEQEVFALLSHQKADAAHKAGKLSEEIIAVQGVVHDGCIRSGSTLEALAGLKPVFDVQGTVTAGTASPLTDGASSLIVTSLGYAEKVGIKPLAAIKSFAISGCPPEVMGIGPVLSTQKALDRAGLKVIDLDVVELNEAFAVQALACMRDLSLDPEIVNIDGGAIALGHPLGATGARILGKAAAILSRENLKYALATQCIGGGQGIATILERVE